MIQINEIYHSHLNLQFNNKNTLQKLSLFIIKVKKVKETIKNIQIP